MLKIILFDFDGVIVDSMKIREHGFKKIFSNFRNDDVEKLLKYHRKNGGISRFKKIRFFYENILKISITDKEINKFANEFSCLMKKLLINPDIIIEETIEYIKKQQEIYKFHIVSGSEHKELCWLCEKLNISQYFLSILGSPIPKPKLISNIINKWNYKIQECALIGDSINDYDAAKSNGIEFWGYNNPDLMNLPVQYIHSFNNFTANN